MDVWPWGACWLQDEACHGIVSAAHKKPWMCGLGVPVGCKMKHAMAHKKPLMCGLGVAAGCRMKKGLESFKGFKGLEGFKRLRAGKRQTWTPIRSY